MSNYRTALDNGIDRLFHYQSYKPAFLENTMVHGIVRFARASEFNDPWDCKPSFHVPDEKDRLHRLIDFMYSASERHTPEFDPAKRKAHADHLLNNPEELRKLLADTVKCGPKWTGVIVCTVSAPSRIAHSCGDIMPTITVASALSSTQKPILVRLYK
jgi:hypothetical protein